MGTTIRATAGARPSRIRRPGVAAARPTTTIDGPTTRPAGAERVAPPSPPDRGWSDDAGQATTRPRHRRTANPRPTAVGAARPLSGPTAAPPTTIGGGAARRRTAVPPARTGRPTIRVTPTARTGRRSTTPASTPATNARAPGRPPQAWQSDLAAERSRRGYADPPGQRRGPDDVLRRLPVRPAGPRRRRLRRSARRRPAYPTRRRLPAPPTLRRRVRRRSRHRPGPRRRAGPARPVAEGPGGTGDGGADRGLRRRVLHHLPEQEGRGRHRRSPPSTTSPARSSTRRR